jgi:hypothetical protein
LAVGLAAGGALLLRSHAPVQPPPVNVVRVEARPPVAPPAPAPSLSTTKDGMMRVEAPPTIIEVTVER